MSALAWACALGWIALLITAVAYCIVSLGSHEQIAELRAKLREAGADCLALQARVAAREQQVADLEAACEMLHAEAAS